MRKMNFREELAKISPKANESANIYFFGCGRHFEDLRNWYRSFANVNLEDYAFAFIDNDVSKQGSEFYGKPVVSPDSVTPDNSVVLITAADYPDYAIDRQMMDKGFFWKSDLIISCQCFNILKSWIFENIMEFKNKHLGERCFIVGGGASLEINDFNMITKEKTFAMNKIYKAFDKTEWRPTYYLTNDSVMTEKWRTINNNIKGYKFFNFNNCFNEINKNKECHLENANFFSLISIAHERPEKYKKPLFGIYPDLFFGGGTSTYSCLQLAVFMGFKEIFLMGIDNEYSVMSSNSGEIIFSENKDHFTSEYHNDSLMEKYNKQGFFAMNKDLVDAAYQSAKEYTESHGIKVYNATRGGRLDVFDRVDFDKLF